MGFFVTLERLLSGNHHVQTRRREVSWFQPFYGSQAKLKHLDLKGLNKFPREIQDSVYLFGDCITLSGAFLASVDIKDAYLHIPIFQPHQQCLQFALKDRHYQFVALSMAFLLVHLTPKIKLTLGSKEFY